MLGTAGLASPLLSSVIIKLFLLPLTTPLPTVTDAQSVPSLGPPLATQESQILENQGPTHPLGWLLSNTWIITSFDRNVEKLESSYVAVENVKWCSPSGEVGWFLRKLNSYN